MGRAMVGTWSAWPVEEWREFLDVFLSRIVVRKGPSLWRERCLPRSGAPRA